MHLQPSYSHAVGMVYRVLPGQYSVYTGQHLLTCTSALPRGQKLLSQTIVVGDEVAFVETSTGGQITAVLPRRSQLERQAVASRKGAYSSNQVIAANIDQVVFVLSAAQPDPHWNLLDRYLVAASASDLPALICITKLDLLNETRARPAQNAVLNDYRRAGYRVVETSSRSGDGLPDLRAALDGRLTALFGSSGVGKTSLLNALAPGLGERVNAVNPVTGDGRPTTSAQIFPLGWASILDTPGVREFGLWDVPADELDRHFPEMQPFLGRCRFRAGCRHVDEPGCAVRAGVAAGQISPRRFRSYLRLQQGE